MIASFAGSPVSDLTEFFTALHQKRLGSKYVLNVYGVLNLIFDVAKDHDLLERGFPSIRHVRCPTASSISSTLIRRF